MAQNEINNLYMSYNMLPKSVSIRHHMFGRAIWEIAQNCIFDIFEIAQVKRGQFQKF